MRNFTSEDRLGMTLLFWLRIFISPLSLGGIFAFFIWFNCNGTVGHSIAIFIAAVGFVGGILLAEKARREKRHSL